MVNDKTNLLIEVANYYSEKLELYGQTPCGVDWNSEEGQVLRFKQLCKIIKPAQHFSINDLGCGYGALVDFLNQRFQEYSYRGFDVSSGMICAAKQRFHNTPQVQFSTASTPDNAADYGVASGIFNVRLGRTDAEWLRYFKDALDVLARTSRVGFAFNCLTSYSDEEKKQDYLYYADPLMLFDLCKRRYSPNVALNHDYGLYEFTILVRKQL